MLYWALCTCAKRGVSVSLTPEYHGFSIGIFFFLILASFKIFWIYSSFFVQWNRYDKMIMSKPEITENDWIRGGSAKWMCCGARVIDPVPDTARNSLITSDMNLLRNWVNSLPVYLKSIPAKGMMYPIVIDSLHIAIVEK